MAIEHLHLETPVPINLTDSAFALTDQLFAERADELQTLPPGKHDMTPTPEETNYPMDAVEKSKHFYVEVLRDGTAICARGGGRGSFIRHPVRGENVDQTALYLPETVTQLCIVAMRRVRALGTPPLPHIFHAIRWRGDTDELSYAPGVQAVTGRESYSDMLPHLNRLYAPSQHS